jgi:hypothetical protein
VPPQARLVVEYIPAGVGVSGEDIVENFTHRMPRCFGLGTQHVALN